MQFFNDQIRANREIRKLYFWFILVTFLTAFSSALAFEFCAFIRNPRYIHRKSFFESLFEPETLQRFCLVLVIVIAFIFITALFKKISLSGNGSKIAALAGGIPVNLKSEDLEKRTYVNVVQEMAIASGISVPKIYYLLGEPSINAFVAGSDINHVAICVTEGALKKLTRDELQALVAHEFGHIFNGDMKVNMRLISVVFGLGCIYGIGLRLMRSRSSRGLGYGSRGGDSGKAGLLGVFLAIVGYFGMLMAHFILSRISQQREFFADAASVQYTRNPDGIGNVLKKIWVSSCPYMQKMNSNEIKHFFFSSSQRVKYFDFKTHPSIKERLLRIYPNIDLESSYKEAMEKFQDLDFIMPIDILDKPIKRKSSKARKPSVPLNREVIDQASVFLSGLPEDLRQGCRDANESKSIVMAILGLQESDRAAFEQLLEKDYTKERATKIIHFYEEIERYDSKVFVPLLDLAMGALKTIQKEEKKEFLVELKKIIMVDKKVNINELIIYLFAYKVLIPSQKKKILASRKRLISNTSVLMSFLAQSTSNPKEGIDAFYSVAKFFGNSPHYVFKDVKEIQFKEMFEALSYLEKAPPDFLETLRNALFELVKYDQKIEAQEYQVVCVYCQILGIPTPC